MTSGKAGAPRDPARGPSRQGTADWLEWLSNQGEMGARTAAFDWSSTGLGPIEAWPLQLRSAVSLCLGSLFPTSVRWGPELIVCYNDACREVYGPERFALALGRPTAEVWPEAAQVSQRLAGILEDGRPFFAADRLVPINRVVPVEECYFTFSYTPIIDESGRPVGVFSTFIETTAEVLAVRRMRTLVELGAQVGAARTQETAAEVAMAVLAGNDSDHPAAAFYRVESPDGLADEALASFGEVFDPTSAAAVVGACLAAGESQHVVAEAAGVSGWHGFPIGGVEPGAVSHVLVVATGPQRPWDAALGAYLGLVTATIAAALGSQAELLAEQRQVSWLAALDASRSAFFAGVSHELRTPLALISAPVQEVLERERGLGAESREGLALVQANVARLTRMVEAMLDFARLEAGRLVPNLVPVDVSALTSALASSFAGAFERAGLEFAVEIRQLSRSALLDRDLFERIVSNLLTNALKYTPAGRVELHLTEVEQEYLIRVSDTGLGIDAADQERVFARFERLAARPGARSAAGAGIGLAMVRNLSELLGGAVSLDSSPGVGSTFTVRLPFVPARAEGVTGSSVTPRHVDSFLAEIAGWQNEGAIGGHQGSATSPRLLVVEDDPDLARFLAGSLCSDYAVDVAADGAEALSLLRSRPIELVLSDVTMAGLDGLGLVAAIRADPVLRDLPVVLLSSRGGAEAAAVGLERGADDYVTKPFSLVDLRGRLAANLARANQRSADAAWRRAIMASLRDPLLIFDETGLVLELNDAFTQLFGYSLADGPLRPPYPWWPCEAEDADALAAVTALHTHREVDAELLFYTSDRRPVWVHSMGSSVDPPGTGPSLRIRVLRDITRAKQAQQRRAAAAQVSADFGRSDDLATLLGVAGHGFEVLFDGGSTIQLDIGERHLFGSGRSLEADELTADVAVGIAGEPSADTTSLRPGILLVPQTSTTAVRAWVQFPRPRRIGADEMIAADLLAQGFGLAVDRLLTVQQAADRHANLQLALESHRLIGQAVGILVERHRLRPAAAFDRLKQSSQNRNLKLRELAVRVIETGAEPEHA